MAAVDSRNLDHPKLVEQRALFRAYLFGTPRLYRGDEELSLETNRKKCIHILSWFLLNPQKPCSADQMVEALWPDVEPAQAMGRFDVNMHALKRILQPDLRPHESSKFVRHHTNRVYSFVFEDSWWSDAADLELLCRRGYAYDSVGDHVRARYYYRRIFTHLSNGPLLGRESEPWLESYRRKYALMCSQALTRLVQLEVIHGVDDEIIEAAYQLLTVEPGNPLASSLILQGVAPSPVGSHEPSLPWPTQDQEVGRHLHRR